MASANAVNALMQQIQADMQAEMMEKSAAYQAAAASCGANTQKINKLSEDFQRDCEAMTAHNQKRVTAALQGKDIGRMGAAKPAEKPAPQLQQQASAAAANKNDSNAQSWPEILENKGIIGDDLTQILPILEEQMLEPDQLADIDQELLQLIGVKSSVIDLWFKEPAVSPWMEFLTAAGIKDDDAKEAAKVLDDNAIEPDQMGDLDLAILRETGVKVGVALRMIKHYKATA